MLYTLATALGCQPHIPTAKPASLSSSSQGGHKCGVELVALLTGR